MHHFRISRLSATNMSIGLVMCHAGHDSMIVLEMLTYLDTMATPRFTAHGRERFQAPSPCILVLFTVLFEMGTPAKSIRQSQ
jgi:hypothetical protein